MNPMGFYKVPAFGGLLLVVGILLAFAGCRPAGPRAPDVPTNATVYPVKGVLIRVSPDGLSAQIRHDKIPGYMEAMTMLLDVKSTNELAGLKPGDWLSFNMVVTPDDGWIQQVKKIGVTNLPPPPAKPPSVRPVRAVAELAEGDLVTDYRFTNELGRAVSFSEFKGQAIAFTFIFTRCPYPDFCPRMTGNFAAAARRLRSQTNAVTNWHLFSISFDTVYDTPASLRDYARRQDYDPARWSFLTGALADIDAITEQFGMYFTPDGSVFSHNLRTVVVTAAGRVQKILVGNNWKPEELADEITKAAQAR